MDGRTTAHPGVVGGEMARKREGLKRGADGCRGKQEALAEKGVGRKGVDGGWKSNEAEEFSFVSAWLSKVVLEFVSDTLC
jgi:hypothetical protein